MSLFVVATPIGHLEDITLRARQLLLAAPIVIGEEKAEVERLLKRNGRQPFPRIELLNEHSKPEEIRELADLCKDHDVVLVSDCGTPGFCDPGVELTAECRKRGVTVVPVPGASSLMALLSVVGQRFGEFHFAGFPPRDEHPRRRWIQKWTNADFAVVMMDTPYRLEKFLNELAEASPARLVLLAMDLTLPTEQILEASLRDLRSKVKGAKGEFILCLYPSRPKQTSALRSTERSTGKRRS